MNAFDYIFLVFSFANVKTEFLKILREGVLLILIFGIVTIGISALVANIKIMEFTACDDGIRVLKLTAG